MVSLAFIDCLGTGIPGNVRHTIVVVMFSVVVTAVVVLESHSGICDC